MKKNSLMKYLNIIYNDFKNNFINSMNKSIKNYIINDYKNYLIEKSIQKTLKLI